MKTTASLLLLLFLTVATREDFPIYDVECENSTKLFAYGTVIVASLPSATTRSIRMPKRRQCIPSGPSVWYNMTLSSRHLFRLTLCSLEFDVAAGVFEGPTEEWQEGCVKSDLEQHCRMTLAVQNNNLDISNQQNGCFDYTFVGNRFFPNSESSHFKIAVHEYYVASDEKRP